MLTHKRERLAEALAIERLHGARAPAWVAERTAVLALSGDVDGVERFAQIAAEMEALLPRGERPC